ncbi:hypothetical protein ACET3X_003830 [Alternaria dauci]|uniref:Uncharacterized protein n=1 Tax=Alternaria dauci TaxID=48095 RepID=A0ABR3UNR0_9PLEO
MIPGVLTTPLEQNTIVTPKAHVSAAPSVPVAARQNSVSDELNAMDDLDSNIFVASANDPQDPQARYREYRLQEDLLSCIQQYGVDPALIKDQSSIGTTSVKDVRFTQCQQALVQCTQKALDEHELSSASWPIADPLERPVLRTNMLQRGMVKCLRVAASDTKKVFSLSDMTEEEFNAYGTVAMCNKHLVLCLEDISGLYDDKVAQWDEDHPQ